MHTHRQRKPDKTHEPECRHTARTSQRGPKCSHARCGGRRPLPNTPPYTPRDPPLPDTSPTPPKRLSHKVLRPPANFPLRPKRSPTASYTPCDHPPKRSLARSAQNARHCPRHFTPLSRKVPSARVSRHPQKCSLARLSGRLAVPHYPHSPQRHAPRPQRLSSTAAPPPPKQLSPNLRRSAALPARAVRMLRGRFEK